jgi:eukaryotic-like serine/threonine-protein kinase
MLQAGIRLGPYEIVSLLGTGGMGEVYRARDPRLGRDVALKVLPAALGHDAGRLRRFEQEARAAAALNHPNIITIHSVEQADGIHFLTMEVVEGRPLQQIIPKTGMPLDRLVSLAVPLADAVSAAHQRGIMHRDLKPGNVMITADGRVKVLDFGLAKAIEPPPLDDRAPTVTATIEGQIVGTIAYMSPEQAEGQPVDQRSDVFSLGVILYQMATGARPFKGDSTISVLSSIIKDTPRAVSELNPALPHELSRVVNRCLAKNPEYRYHSAKDLRNDLLDLQQRETMSRPAGGLARRLVPTAVIGAIVVVALVAGRMWLGSGATAGPIGSLAVLPFVNVAGDPNTEYLSDGITENLINSFSLLSRLRVVPRNRVFRYKGREAEAEKVGRELNVVAVLTGRVVQHGDDLNVQTELIDVASDSQPWGRQYTARLSEIITLQEQITRDVAEKLRLSPTTEEQKRLTKRYTESAAAHQAYLKGRYFWNRRTRETVRQAAQYFQEAIDQDPGYALAWAGLADCYGVYGVYSVVSNKDAILRAKHAAAKALEIDETLAEAHASLGYADGYDWHWADAEREFERAIALNPSYPTADHWRATNYLEPMGRLDEALAELERAEELDPLSLVISSVRARTLLFARRYDQASRQLAKIFEIDSNFALAHDYAGMLDEQTGKVDEAIAQFKDWQRLSGEDPAATAGLGHAYAVAGKRADAVNAMATLAEWSQTRYVSPYDVAVVHAGLGEKNAAIEWLRRAYDDHSAWLIWVNLDPRFDAIRDDERYREILRGVGIPETKK